LTAAFAALWVRVTAFLVKRLIGRGEGKFLSAVTAGKLNISGHGTPRAVITLIVQSSLGFAQRFFVEISKSYEFGRAVGGGCLSADFRAGAMIRLLLRTCRPLQNGAESSPAWRAA
jgi:hypothetical protein